MESAGMKSRLVDACLALGHICTTEAKWSSDPEAKAAMVRHAISFLEAAHGFLESYGCSGRVRQRDRRQQESEHH